MVLQPYNGQSYTELDIVAPDTLTKLQMEGCMFWGQNTDFSNHYHALLPSTRIWTNASRFAKTLEYGGGPISPQRLWSIVWAVYCSVVKLPSLPEGPEHHHSTLICPPRQGTILALHVLKSNKGLKGLSCSPHKSLDGQTCSFSSCQHFRLSCPNSMVGNPHQLFRAYFKDCTVRAPTSGLRVCLATLHLLSFLHCTQLDFMICLSVPQRCMILWTPFTVSQQQAMQGERRPLLVCTKSTVRRTNIDESVRSLPRWRCLFYDFTAQSCATSAKSQSVVPLMQLYIIRDWQVI